MTPGYGMGVDEDGNDVIVQEGFEAPFDVIVQEGSELPSEAPFQVGEEIEVGDISDVKQSLLPVSKGVHGRIRKAGVTSNEDKTLKSLKLEIELPEGIYVDNPETGETEAQYVGKVIFTGFMELCIWASPDRPDKKGWFKSKQHLLGFKELLTALGEDVKSVKVNDAFFERIVGRDVSFSIRHEANSQKGPDGKRVKDGTMREKFGQWKKYEVVE